jgi:hypothetical protein
MHMVVVGVDPHKHSHTAVAVDHNGRELGQITVGNTAGELIRLLEWAQGWPGAKGGGRSWRQCVTDARFLLARCGSPGGHARTAPPSR